MVGGAAMTLALVVIATTNSWLMLIAVMLISGLGSGTIDAGLNAYLAQHHGERAMNWLHAAFGVGITVSPLILTAIFAADQSWRIGYGIVAVFLGVVALMYLATVGWWRSIVPDTGDQPANRVSMRATLRLPIVWMGILMFFLYAGLETTPGQWMFTYFTKARGIVEEVRRAVGQHLLGQLHRRANFLRRDHHAGEYTDSTARADGHRSHQRPADLVESGRLGRLHRLNGARLRPSTDLPGAGLQHAATGRRRCTPPTPSASKSRARASASPRSRRSPGWLANNVSPSIPPFIVVAAMLLFVLYELSLMQAARIRPATTTPTS